MYTKSTSADEFGQAHVVDYLEVSLREGKAISLDILLKLTPDEPLICAEPFRWKGPLPPETRVLVIEGLSRQKWLLDTLSENGVLSGVPLITLDWRITPRPGDVLVMNHTCKIVHGDWSEEELALGARYPGVHLDTLYREARKYNSPLGEPLPVFVRELLITAKMHWSREVQGYAGRCIDGAVPTFNLGSGCLAIWMIQTIGFGDGTEGLMRRQKNSTHRLWIIPVPFDAEGKPMSQFDYYLDSAAPRGLAEYQYSSIELARMFGCDEPDDTEEPQESDGLYEAALKSGETACISRELLAETEPTLHINASEETKYALAGDTMTFLRAASKQKLAKIWRPDGTIKPAARVK